MWVDSVLSWHDYVWMTNEWGAQTQGVWYIAQDAHCLRAPNALQSNCARLKNCTLLGDYDSTIPPQPSWSSHSKQVGVRDALHSQERLLIVYRTNFGGFHAYLIHSACYNVTWKTIHSKCTSCGNLMLKAINLEEMKYNVGRINHHVMLPSNHSCSCARFEIRKDAYF